MLFWLIASEPTPTAVWDALVGGVTRPDPPTTDGSLNLRLEKLFYKRCNGRCNTYKGTIVTFLIITVYFFDLAHQKISNAGPISSTAEELVYMTSCGTLWRLHNGTW